MMSTPLTIDSILHTSVSSKNSAFQLVDGTSEFVESNILLETSNVSLSANSIMQTEDNAIVPQSTYIDVSAFEASLQSYEIGTLLAESSIVPQNISDKSDLEPNSSVQIPDGEGLSAPREISVSQLNNMEKVSASRIADIEGVSISQEADVDGGSIAQSKVLELSSLPNNTRQGDVTWTPMLTESSISNNDSSLLELRNTIYEETVILSSSKDSSRIQESEADNTNSHVSLDQSSSLQIQENAASNTNSSLQLSEDRSVLLDISSSLQPSDMKEESYNSHLYTSMEQPQLTLFISSSISRSLGRTSNLLDSSSLTDEATIFPTSIISSSSTITPGRTQAIDSSPRTENETKFMILVSSSITVDTDTQFLTPSRLMTQEDNPSSIVQSSYGEISSDPISDESNIKQLNSELTKAIPQSIITKPIFSEGSVISSSDESNRKQVNPAVTQVIPQSSITESIFSEDSVISSSGESNIKQLNSGLTKIIPQASITESVFSKDSIISPSDESNIKQLHSVVTKNIPQSSVTESVFSEDRIISSSVPFEDLYSSNINLSSVLIYHSSKYDVDIRPSSVNLVSSNVDVSQVLLSSVENNPNYLLNNSNVGIVKESTNGFYESVDNSIDQSVSVSNADIVNGLSSISSSFAAENITHNFVESTGYPEQSITNPELSVSTDSSQRVNSTFNLETSKTVSVENTGFGTENIAIRPHVYSTQNTVSMQSESSLVVDITPSSVLPMEITSESTRSDSSLVLDINTSSEILSELTLVSNILSVPSGSDSSLVLNINSSYEILSEITSVSNTLSVPPGSESSLVVDMDPSTEILSEITSVSNTLSVPPGSDSSLVLDINSSSEILSEITSVANTLSVPLGSDSSLVVDINPSSEILGELTLVSNTLGVPPGSDSSLVLDINHSSDVRSEITLVSNTLSVPPGLDSSLVLDINHSSDVRSEITLVSNTLSVPPGSDSSFVLDINPSSELLSELKLVSNTLSVPPESDSSPLADINPSSEILSELTLVSNTLSVSSGSDSSIALDLNSSFEILSEITLVSNTLSDPPGSESLIVLDIKTSSEILSELTLVSNTLSDPQGSDSSLVLEIKPSSEILSEITLKSNTLSVPIRSDSSLVLDVNPSSDVLSELKLVSNTLSVPPGSDSSLVLASQFNVFDYQNLKSNSNDALGWETETIVSSRSHVYSEFSNEHNTMPLSSIITNTPDYTATLKTGSIIFTNTLTSRSINTSLSLSTNANTPYLTSSPINSSPSLTSSAIIITNIADSTSSVIDLVPMSTSSGTTIANNPDFTSSPINPTPTLRTVVFIHSLTNDLYNELSERPTLKTTLETFYSDILVTKPDNMETSNSATAGALTELDGYLLSCVVDPGGQDVNSAAFKDSLVKDLDILFTSAIAKNSEGQRQKRAAAADVSVKIQDIKEVSPNSAEVQFTVSLDGQPVQADQAVNMLNTLTDEEIQQIMNLKVLESIKAVNQLPSIQLSKTTQVDTMSDTLQPSQTKSSPLSHPGDQSILSKDLSVDTPYSTVSEIATHPAVSDHILQLTISKDTTQQTVSDDTPYPSMSYDTPHSTHSGDTPLPTHFKDTPYLSVSEDTPRPTLSDDILQSTISEYTLYPTTSKNTSKPTLSEAVLHPTASEDTSQPTISEYMSQETLTEDTLQPTVSEDKLQPTVSEDKLQPTVSEDKLQPTVSEDTLQPTVSENIPISTVFEYMLQLTMSEDTLQPSVSDDTPDSTHSRDTPNLKVSEDTPQPTHSEYTPYLSVSEDTTYPTVSEDMSQATVSEDTLQPTVSEDMLQPTVSEDTLQPTVSEDMLQPTVSEDTLQPTVSEDTLQPTVSEDMLQPTASEDTLQPTVSEDTLQPTVSEDMSQLTITEHTLQATTFEDMSQITLYEYTSYPSFSEDTVYPLISEYTSYSTVSKDVLHPTNSIEPDSFSDQRLVLSTNALEDSLHPTPIESVVSGVDFIKSKSISLTPLLMSSNNYSESKASTVVEQDVVSSQINTIYSIIDSSLEVNLESSKSMKNFDTLESSTPDHQNIRNTRSYSDQLTSIKSSTEIDLDESAEGARTNSGLDVNFETSEYLNILKSGTLYLESSQYVRLNTSYDSDSFDLNSITQLSDAKVLSTDILSNTPLNPNTDDEELLSMDITHSTPTRLKRYSDSSIINSRLQSDSLVIDSISVTLTEASLYETTADQITKSEDTNLYSLPMTLSDMLLDASTPVLEESDSLVIDFISVALTEASLDKSIADQLAKSKDTNVYSSPPTTLFDIILDASSSISDESDSFAINHTHRTDIVNVNVVTSLQQYVTDNVLASSLTDGSPSFGSVRYTSISSGQVHILETISTQAQTLENILSNDEYSFTSNINPTPVFYSSVENTLSNILYALTPYIQPTPVSNLIEDEETSLNFFTSSLSEKVLDNTSTTTSGNSLNIDRRDVEDSVVISPSQSSVAGVNEIQSSILIVSSELIGNTGEITTHLSDYQTSGADGASTAEYNSSIKYISSIISSYGMDELLVYSTLISKASLNITSTEPLNLGLSTPIVVESSVATFTNDSVMESPVEAVISETISAFVDLVTQSTSSRLPQSVFHDESASHITASTVTPGFDLSTVGNTTWSSIALSRSGYLSSPVIESDLSETPLTRTDLSYSYTPTKLSAIYTSSLEPDATAANVQTLEDYEALSSSVYLSSPVESDLSESSLTIYSSYTTSFELITVLDSMKLSSSDHLLPVDNKTDFSYSGKSTTFESTHTTRFTTADEAQTLAAYITSVSSDHLSYSDVETDLSDMGKSITRYRSSTTSFELPVTTTLKLLEFPETDTAHSQLESSVVDDKLPISKFSVIPTNSQEFGEGTFRSMTPVTTTVELIESSETDTVHSQIESSVVDKLPISNFSVITTNSQKEFAEGAFGTMTPVTTTAELVRSSETHSQIESSIMVYESPISRSTSFSVFPINSHDSTEEISASMTPVTIKSSTPTTPDKSSQPSTVQSTNNGLSTTYISSSQSITIPNTAAPERDLTRFLVKMVFDPQGQDVTSEAFKAQLRSSLLMAFKEALKRRQGQRRKRDLSEPVISVKIQKTGRVNEKESTAVFYVTVDDMPVLAEHTEGLFADYSTKELDEITGVKTLQPIAAVARPIEASPVGTPQRSSDLLNDAHPSGIVLTPSKHTNDVDILTILSTARQPLTTSVHTNQLTSIIQDKETTTPSTIILNVEFPSSPSSLQTIQPTAIGHETEIHPSANSQLINIPPSVSTSFIPTIVPISPSRLTEVASMVFVSDIVDQTQTHRASEEIKPTSIIDELTPSNAEIMQSTEVTTTLSTVIVSDTVDQIQTHRASEEIKPTSVIDELSPSDAEIVESTEVTTTLSRVIVSVTVDQTQTPRASEKIKPTTVATSVINDNELTLSNAEIVESTIITSVQTIIEPSITLQEIDPTTATNTGSLNVISISVDLKTSDLSDSLDNFESAAIRPNFVSEGSTSLSNALETSLDLVTSNSFNNLETSNGFENSNVLFSDLQSSLLATTQSSPIDNLVSSTFGAPNILTESTQLTLIADNVTTPFSLSASGETLTFLEQTAAIHSTNYVNTITVSSNTPLTDSRVVDTVIESPLSQTAVASLDALDSIKIPQSNMSEYNSTTVYKDTYFSTTANDLITSEISFAQATIVSTDTIKPSVLPSSDISEYDMTMVYNETSSPTTVDDLMITDTSFAQTTKAGVDLASLTINTGIIDTAILLGSMLESSEIQESIGTADILSFATDLDTSNSLITGDILSTPTKLETTDDFETDVRTSYTIVPTSTEMGLSNILLTSVENASSSFIPELSTVQVLMDSVNMTLSPTPTISTSSPDISNVLPSFVSENISLSGNMSGTNDLLGSRTDSLQIETLDNLKTTFTGLDNGLSLISSFEDSTTPVSIMPEISATDILPPSSSPNNNSILNGSNYSTDVTSDSLPMSILTNTISFSTTAMDYSNVFGSDSSSIDIAISKSTRVIDYSTSVIESSYSFAEISELIATTLTASTYIEPTTPEISSDQSAFSELTSSTDSILNDTETVFIKESSLPETSSRHVSADNTAAASPAATDNVDSISGTSQLLTLEDLVLSSMFPEVTESTKTVLQELTLSSTVLPELTVLEPIRSTVTVSNDPDESPMSMDTITNSANITPSPTIDMSSSSVLKSNLQQLSLQTSAVTPSDGLTSSLPEFASTDTVAGTTTEFQPSQSTTLPETESLPEFTSTDAIMGTVVFTPSQSTSLLLETEIILPSKSSSEFTSKDTIPGTIIVSKPPQSTAPQETVLPSKSLPELTSTVTVPTSTTVTPTLPPTTTPSSDKMMVISVSVKSTTNITNGVFKKQIETGLALVYVESINLANTGGRRKRDLAGALTNTRRKRDLADVVFLYKRDTTDAVTVNVVNTERDGGTSVTSQFYVNVNGEPLPASEAVPVYNRLNNVEKSALLGHPVLGPVRALGVAAPAPVTEPEEDRTKILFIVAIVLPCVLVLLLIAVLARCYFLKRENNLYYKRGESLEDHNLTVDVEKGDIISGRSSRASQLLSGDYFSDTSRKIPLEFDISTDGNSLSPKRKDSTMGLVVSKNQKNADLAKRYKTESVPTSPRHSENDSSITEKDNIPMSEIPSPKKPATKQQSIHEATIEKTEVGVTEHHVPPPVPTHRKVTRSATLERSKGIEVETSPEQSPKKKKGKPSRRNPNEYYYLTKKKGDSQSISSESGDHTDASEEFTILVPKSKTARHVEGYSNRMFTDSEMTSSPISPIKRQKTNRLEKQRKVDSQSLRRSRISSIDFDPCYSPENSFVEEVETPLEDYGHYYSGYRDRDYSQEYPERRYHEDQLSYPNDPEQYYDSEDRLHVPDYRQDLYHPEDDQRQYLNNDNDVENKRGYRDHRFNTAGFYQGSKDNTLGFSNDILLNRELQSTSLSTGYHQMTTTDTQTSDQEQHHDSHLLKSNPMTYLDPKTRDMKTQTTRDVGAQLDAVEEISLPVDYTSDTIPSVVVDRSVRIQESTSEPISSRPEESHVNQHTSRPRSPREAQTSPANSRSRSPGTSQRHPPLYNLPSAEALLHNNWMFHPLAPGSHYQHSSIQNQLPFPAYPNYAPVYPNTMNLPQTRLSQPLTSSIQGPVNQNNQRQTNGYYLAEPEYSSLHPTDIINLNNQTDRINSSMLHTQPVIHSRMARFNPYEGLPPEPPAVRYQHIPEPNFLLQPEFPPLDSGIERPENSPLTFYQDPFENRQEQNKTNPSPRASLHYTRQFEESLDEDELTKGNESSMTNELLVSQLLSATKKGDLEQVLSCLYKLDDINATSKNGLTALQVACKEGHLEIVKELIRKGSNVLAVSKKGNTALHIASLAGHLDVVRVLVEHDVNINAQAKGGFTSLYMAAQEGHTDVVRYLLDNGASQHIPTKDGFTPLAVALQQGHEGVYTILIEIASSGKVHLPTKHNQQIKPDEESHSSSHKNRDRKKRPSKPNQHRQGDSSDRSSSPRRHKKHSPREDVDENSFQHSENLDSRNSENLDSKHSNKSSSRHSDKSSPRHAEEESQLASPRQHKDDKPRKERKTKRRHRRDETDKDKQQTSRDHDDVTDDVSDRSSPRSPRRLTDDDKSSHIVSKTKHKKEANSSRSNNQKSSPRSKYYEDETESSRSESLRSDHSVVDKQDSDSDQYSDDSFQSDSDTQSSQVSTPRKSNRSKPSTKTTDYSSDESESELSDMSAPSDSFQSDKRRQSPDVRHSRPKTRMARDEESDVSQTEESSSHDNRDHSNHDNSQLNNSKDDKQNNEKHKQNGETLYSDEEEVSPRSRNIRFEDEQESQQFDKQNKKTSPRKDPQDLYSQIKLEMLKSYKDLNRKTAKSMPDRVENLTDDQLLLLYEFHRRRLLFQGRQEASVKAKVLVNEAFLTEEIRRLRKQQQNAKKKMKKILDDAFPSTCEKV